MKKLIEIEENSEPQIVVSSESVSPSNVEPTEPSSYDLLVNLMDHFNLNAIINSIQDDTLDQQIKPVSKTIDNSEEDLQESIVIPSEVPEAKTTTSRVEIATTENVQETTSSGLKAILATIIAHRFQKMLMMDCIQTLQSSSKRFCCWYIQWASE